MKTTLELLHPRSLKYFAVQFAVLLESKLWAKILFGMVLGVVFGSLLSLSGGPFSDSLQEYRTFIEDGIHWMALPGKFFLKMIQMVIVPLILVSIIKGLASANSLHQMKSLGMRFAAFVLITSTLSAVLAIILGKIFHPGSGLNLTKSNEVGVLNQVPLSFAAITPDTLLGILPTNPLASIVQGQMLEVVVIAIIGGISLVSIKYEQSKAVIDLLDGMQSICMTVIAWAMKLAPYAVFGLMTQVASSVGIKSLGSMGKYVLTAYLGYVIIIVLYGLILYLLTKSSPLNFVRKIKTPLLLAFSTSSSAATMPMTMKTAEEDLNVEPSVARFLIPLGTTVNMAGLAFWQTTAVIFVSQIYGVDLSLGQLTFVVATSVGSAIGSPGVPGVGIGILAMVLGNIGIPVEGISLIIGVDRIVDMGCTVVNVAGDLTACKLFGTRTA